jgi:hypothetical protein
MIQQLCFRCAVFSKRTGLKFAAEQQTEPCSSFFVSPRWRSEPETYHISSNGGSLSLSLSTGHGNLPSSDAYDVSKLRYIGARSVCGYLVEACDDNCSHDTLPNFPTSTLIIQWFKVSVHTQLSMFVAVGFVQG